MNYTKEKNKFYKLFKTHKVLLHYTWLIAFNCIHMSKYGVLINLLESQIEKENDYFDYNGIKLSSA